MVRMLHIKEQNRRIFVGLAVFILVLLQIPVKAAGIPSGTPENSKLTITNDITVTGDGDFVIWCRDIDMYRNYIEDIYAQYNSEISERITYVTFWSSEEFNTNLLEILDDPADPLYPDLVLVDISYYPYELLNPGYLLTADDLGITEEDMSQMFPFAVESFRDNNGDIRGFCTNASISGFHLRADLAEEYLGTTDPEELHDRYFSNPKTMLAAARRIWLESNGMVSLFPGYDDLCAGGMYIGKDDFWYDDNGVLMDEVTVARIARLTMAFDRFTFGYDSWSWDWIEAMDGDGVNSRAVIAYSGAPWFSYVLNTDSWYDNAIVVEGINPSTWGGNAFLVPAECSDVDLAADIIRTLTCNEEAMSQMYEMSYDFINNVNVMNEVSGSDYVNNTNMAYVNILENNPEIHIRQYDSEINQLFREYLGNYSPQGISDSLSLAGDFLNEIAELHPELRTQ